MDAASFRTWIAAAAFQEHTGSLEYSLPASQGQAIGDTMKSGRPNVGGIWQGRTRQRRTAVDRGQHKFSIGNLEAHVCAKRRHRETQIFLSQLSSRSSSCWDVSHSTRSEGSEKPLGQVGRLWLAVHWTEEHQSRGIPNQGKKRFPNSNRKIQESSAHTG